VLFALQTVLPVFAVVALGYALAARRELHLGTLADLAILITSPALVFSVLSGTALEPRQLGTLVGGVLWIAAGTGLVAWLYLRARPDAGRGVLLPAVFWNAGNLSLPCARLAFGEPGLEAASIVFVTMALLSSSFGIWIAKGERGFGEALRLPLLWASLGGLVLALTETTLPRPVMEPIEMVGAMAIPLMLLTLGIQLRVLEVSDLRHSLVAVTIRLGGGAVLGAIFVGGFGVSGVDRQVLLLTAVMPSAVINVVMAQRYDTAPGLVASAIVISTLLSVLAIPAVIYWVS
jgi:predicted permease